MPEFDLAALFGLKPKKPDPRVSLALMLKHLMELLQVGEEDEDEAVTQNPPEAIPVRPRVEPMGG